MIQKLKDRDILKNINSILSSITSLTSGKANTIHSHSSSDITGLHSSATSGNADTVDGKHAADFSLSTHNHDSLYLKLTGGALSGPLSVDGGLGSFSIKPGTADHAYMQIFARTASPTIRSGFLGYGSTGSMALTLSNEITDGHIDITTKGAGTVNINSKIGIGGISASYPLDVNGSIRTNSILYLQGSSMTSRIRSNSTAGREELQIYAAGDAYDVGSRGSGIHLYGNADNEHPGNIALMTGLNDKGTARMIISQNGTTTIGNSIWDFVDTGKNTALINIKDPSGKPAILVSGCNETEGDFAVPDGDRIDMGHWSGTVFTPRLSIDSTGKIISPGHLILQDGINAVNYYCKRNIGAKLFETYMGVTTSGQGIISAQKDGVQFSYMALNENGSLGVKGLKNWFALDDVTHLPKGEAGLDLNNSDIVGANAIVFNDSINSGSEGIFFPYSTTTTSTTNLADYDRLYASDGELYLSGNNLLQAYRFGQGYEAGTYWRTFEPNMLECWGAVTVPTTTVNVTAKVDITFPLSFASSPVMSATANTTVPEYCKVSTTSSANSCSILCNRTTATATTVHWRAIGKIA